MLKIKKETVRKSLFSYIIEKSLGGARFWPIFLFNFLFFFQLLTPCSKFEMEKMEKLLTLFFFASTRKKKNFLPPREKNFKIFFLPFPYEVLFKKSFYLKFSSKMKIRL